MCEKTGQQLMFTSWKPSFLVPVTPGCKAKVQRLSCTTGVMLSLTCRVLNDAEGDKSLQNELRSKAYDWRLAATDVKRRDLLLYSVTQRFIVSSASSLTPKFRNKCLGEYTDSYHSQTELRFTQLLCRVNMSGHAGQSGSTSWRCIKRLDHSDKLKPLTGVLYRPTFERGGIRRGWAVGWLSSSVCDASTELILKSSLVGPSWPQTSLRCLPVTCLSPFCPSWCHRYHIRTSCISDGLSWWLNISFFAPLLPTEILK